MKDSDKEKLIKDIADRNFIINQYKLKGNIDRAEAIRKINELRISADKKDEIWMLRYGFTFDDIEWVEPYIDSIDENEIVFSDKIAELDDIKSKVIEKYIYK